MRLISCERLWRIEEVPLNPFRLHGLRHVINLRDGETGRAMSRPSF